MNKTLAITTVSLVAVLMGFGTVATILPPAEASHRCNDCLVISNIGSSGDAAVDPPVKNAKCTATYDKNGRLVSQTHSSNANGEMVFPLRGWDASSPDIDIKCWKGDLRSFSIIDANDSCVRDGDVDDCRPKTTALQPGDEIMVLLRP